MISVSPKSVLAVVCSATFFGVLNASAVNVVLPDIAQALQVEPGKIGWVVSLFLLVYGVAIPLYGRLAERFGSRSLFLAGLLLFGAGCIACAVAPSANALLAARVLQGLGGAAFPGSGMALVSTSFAPERRGRALGVVAATMGAGAAIGPLLGGALAGWVSWRLLFGVSALALGVLPFAWRALPKAQGPGRSVDLLGGVFLALGVAAALLAVTEGTRLGWSPRIGLTLCGAAIAVGLVVWRQGSADPFLPKVLLGSRPYLASVTMSFCATGIYLAILVGVPLMLSASAGLTPLQVGLVLLPSALVTSISGVMAGALVDRLGPKIPTRLGTLLMGAVAAALAWIPQDDPVLVSIAAAFLALGYALVNTPIAAAIGDLVPTNLLPSALSLNAMIFFIGGSFGSALMVSVSSTAGFSSAYLLLLGPAFLCAAMSVFLPASPVST